MTHVEFEKEINNAFPSMPSGMSWEYDENRMEVSIYDNHKMVVGLRTDPDGFQVRQFMLDPGKLKTHNEAIRNCISEATVYFSVTA